MCLVQFERPPECRLLYVAECCCLGERQLVVESVRAPHVDKHIHTIGLVDASSDCEWYRDAVSIYHSLFIEYGLEFGDGDDCESQRVAESNPYVVALHRRITQSHPQQLWH
jgi:hypothetical protein